MAISRTRGAERRSRRPEAQRRTSATTCLSREEFGAAEGERSRRAGVAAISGAGTARTPRPYQAREAAWVGLKVEEIGPATGTATGGGGGTPRRKKAARLIGARPQSEG